MKVWIVGRVDKRDYLRWEFQGVYDDKQKAIAACEDETWFIGPAQVNAPIPKESIEWPGAFYPKHTPLRRLR